MKFLSKLFTAMPFFAMASIAIAGDLNTSTISYGFIQKGNVYLQTHESGDAFFVISKQEISEQGIDPVNLIDKAVKGNLSIKCSRILKSNKTLSSCLEPEFNVGLDRRMMRDGE